MKDRQEVILEKCVDGDTAHFMLNRTKIKARFLAIDTPEITGTPEAYGHEASDFSCGLMSNATTLEIAYDTKSTQQDKYARDLVWVYVDGKLLQGELIDKGLAKVAYIYGEYEYVDDLKSREKVAQSKQLGIWSSYESHWSVMNIVEIIVIVLLLMTSLSSRTRKKLLKRLKRISKS